MSNQKNRNHNTQNQTQVQNPNALAKGTIPERKKEMPALIKVNVGRVAEAAGNHPVLTGILAGLGVITVGGGAYMSHDIMKHGYDGEFSLLNIVRVKLNKKQ